MFATLVSITSFLARSIFYDGKVSPSHVGVPSTYYHSNAGMSVGVLLMVDCVYRGYHGLIYSLSHVYANTLMLLRCIHPYRHVSICVTGSL